jgi:hypothetical protein
VRGKVGRLGGGGKIFVHPPLYPLPPEADKPIKGGAVDIGYPSVCCREVHSLMIFFQRTKLLRIFLFIILNDKCKL